MSAINHNLPALRIANELACHYQNLAVSTQRLSTGQRVNSAADDASGVAIGELMRADIAALQQQRIRNVNDAISMTAILIMRFSCKFWQFIMLWFIGNMRIWRRLASFAIHAGAQIRIVARLLSKLTTWHKYGKKAILEDINVRNS